MIIFPEKEKDKDNTLKAKKEKSLLKNAQK